MNRKEKDYRSIIEGNLIRIMKDVLQTDDISNSDFQSLFEACIHATPIAQGKIIDGPYSQIYYKTNEPLADSDIFTMRQFNGKRVLTILGSGDPILLAYYLGAERVAAFDVNPLAKYYAGLRSIALKSGLLYPPTQKKELEKLLSDTTNFTHEEQSAAILFRYLLERDADISKLFYDITVQPKGSIPFEQADFDGNEFARTDIFLLNIFEPMEIIKKRKYDVIVLSNVFDWIGRCDSKEQAYENAIKNLDSLLEDDGIIILTQLIPNQASEQLEYLKRFFSVEVPANSPFIICRKSPENCIRIKR